MGAPVIPSSPLMKTRGAPWRSEAMQHVLATTGRTARLDVGLLFNFDGTLTSGLGDPRQAQLGVKLIF